MHVKQAEYDVKLQFDPFICVIDGNGGDPAGPTPFPFYKHVAIYG